MNAPFPEKMIEKFVQFIILTLDRINKWKYL